MENYICKIASPEEMERKWDYEIALHSEKGNWITWKGEAIEGARAGRSIPYYGILDGTIICEATAVLNPDFGQVEPEEKTNREIYSHWGFTEHVFTGTETYPDGTVIDVEFYGKQL